MAMNEDKNSGDINNIPAESDYEKSLKEFYEYMEEDEKINSNIITSKNSSGIFISSNLSNSIGGISSSSNIFNWGDSHKDPSEIFIKVTRHITDDHVIGILNSIKEKKDFHNYYLKCLLNLISFPNYRLMPESFLTEKFEEIQEFSYSSTGKVFDFEMIYGKLLDDMPALKLLLKLKE
jgi:hypothetical protein